MSIKAILSKKVILNLNIGRHHKQFFPAASFNFKHEEWRKID
jgi:hypothetical protein